MTDKTRGFVGAWMSDTQDTEWGDVVFEYVFDDDFALTCTIRPPDPISIDNRIVITGKYHVVGDKIITDIGTGEEDETIILKIKGDTLLVQPPSDQSGDESGAIIRLYRKETHPDVSS